ncbi:MAG: LLM class flavin-dependent oxidoreductase [Immundisolibacter sp.]|uniref:LLM class flavin-dependent oxidoreductase n=1 Tax=Immundisolibacter sp. TaxID=1934948 RepID=UPI003D12BC3E
MPALRFGVYCEMQSAPNKAHPELTWEVFRLIEHADTLGYDVYSLIEHHFFPTFGISANPLALFTAVAQRTQQIRLRTLCHTLPLHNPLILAGEIAQADILTGGRLEVGVGRGHAWLYPPSGIPFAESRGRYEEALELLRLAWSGERFSFDGQFTKVRDVQVVPQPLQKPYPPIYMTGTSGQAFRIAARHGWRICSGGPAPIEVFADGFSTYRQACTEHGTTPHVGYVRAVFLADDEATAHREARDAILNFYAYNVRPHDSLLDPALQEPMKQAGYGFYASDALQGMKRLSYDDIIEQDMVYVGTPEQVVRRLTDLHGRWQFDEFSIVSHYGGIAPHQAYRNQELFARRVMPAFR